MRMRHEEDPAKATFKKLGDLKGYAVLNNYVLYAIYERPLVTQGGIHLTHTSAGEDEYQGKAGLIVAVGPMVNDEAEIRGLKLERGTWIAVRPSDGWAIKVNGVLCRMINEKSVHMVIPTPDSVW
jgi:co-chaperonin GroES (HSP10)